MKLVFLHGAPAVGKLTIAKELVRITSARLFDNHAAIDLAQTVFDFGTPGFWDLVGETRVSVLKFAARENVPLLVMTTCYSDPEDRQTFENYEAVLATSRSKILPVYLYCSIAEMHRRVANTDRKTRKKISTRNSLQSFLNEYNLVPVPHADCLEIDTEKNSAVDIANDIIERFGLARQ